jgi:membrane-bound metal-dependent hydrolase YbcI (DUF457 family)
MDPISHIVLGSALTRWREPPPAARGAALAIGLGALAPDIDLVLLPAGWDRYLVAHQAGTHSLIGAVICGALAAALVRVAIRHTPYGAIAAIAIVSALSHVVADLLTGGTIRLLWPVVDAPTSNAGVVAFGDPYAVALCAAGGLLMLLWKRRRAQCAVALLVAFTLFAGAKAVARERAEAAYRAATGGTQAYLVEPVWGSLTDWRIVDGSPDRVRAFVVGAAGAVRLEADVRRATGDRAAIDASRAWDVVRNLLRAHEFTFALAEQAAGPGRRVVWSDLRYCPAHVVLPTDCAIVVAGEIDGAGHVTGRMVRIGGLVQPR